MLKKMIDYLPTVAVVTVVALVLVTIISQGVIEHIHQIEESFNAPEKTSEGYREPTDSNFVP